MKYKLLLLLSLSFSFNIHAQDCKVKLSALQGKYEGGCKNDLAHGMGNAMGEDSYTGFFKAGYPNGKGKYTWSNKSWFQGNFKNGLLDGEGVMHIVTATSNDSVITGFWKNNMYIGENEKPYKVHSKTYMVASVGVVLNKAIPLNQVIIDMESVSGGSINIHGEIPKVELTNILVKKGGYLLESSVGIMQKRNVYTLRDVRFPFWATFEIAVYEIGKNPIKEEVEVEFFQAGTWKVSIKMRQ